MDLMTERIKRRKDMRSVHFGTKKTINFRKMFMKNGAKLVSMVRATFSFSFD